MLLLWMVVLGVQDSFPLAEGHTWTYEVEGEDGLPDAVKRVSGREKVGDVECFVLEDKGYPATCRRCSSGRCRGSCGWSGCGASWTPRSRG